jgi:hypothetical protein
MAPQDTPPSASPQIVAPIDATCRGFLKTEFLLMKRAFSTVHRIISKKLGLRLKNRMLLMHDNAFPQSCNTVQDFLKLKKD